MSRHVSKERVIMISGCKIVIKILDKRRDYQQCYE